MKLQRIDQGNWAYCLAQAKNANKRVSTGRELIEDRNILVFQISMPFT